MKNHKQASRFGIWLAAFTVMTTSLLASATVYVRDPFPIAAGAYTNGASVCNTTPAHDDIDGFSGKWDAVNSTTVMQSRTFGLSYPENVFLSSSYGCLTISYAAEGATSGRMISRVVTSAPNSGTLYYSVLIKADTTALSMLAANQTYGIGFGKTWKPSTSVALSLPTDGVYFGFWKNASGAKGSLDYTSIILRVNGSNSVLLDAPVPGQTYFCVAKIEIGAGAASAEIVSAVVNPTSASVFTPEATTSVESELIGATTFTYVNAGGLYATGNSYVYFDELILADTLQEAAFAGSADTPFFETAPVVALDGAQTDFVFTAKLSNGTGDVYALVGGPDAYDITNLVATAATTNAPVSVALSGLAADTCYRYAALADGDGEWAFQTGERTFFTGVVAVQAVADADEDGLVPGRFRIVRPDTPDATRDDLLVDYVVSGTAGPGTNYVALLGSVLIPAGTNQAEIAVTPMIDGPTLDATSLTLSAVPTAYYTNATSSATISIGSLDLPADKNVWIAPAAGNASVASNWSKNLVPAGTDDILLGIYSTAALTWDAGVNGLPTNVASWTQTPDYTGAVTLDTKRGTSFDNFVIAGNAVLSGGSWTHSQDPNNSTRTDNTVYGLRCTVGGNLTTENGYTFNGYGRGYVVSGGPSGGWAQWGGRAHGGQGGINYQGGGVIYGNYLEPRSLGSTGGGQLTDGLGGGGAFHITVGGLFQHDGVLTANGAPIGWYAGNTGGSIYIKAYRLAGGGTIQAEGGTIAGPQPGAGGGRIAIHLSDESATYTSFTNDFRGAISAAGSLCTSTPAAGTDRNPGANGTIYVEVPGDNGAGTLRFYDKGFGPTATYPDTIGCAPVTENQTWPVSRIILEQTGRIGVMTNGVLRIPSFSCIESDGAAMNALCLLGGTIENATEGDVLDLSDFNLDSRGDNVFDWKVVLNSTRTLSTVDGNLTLGGLRIDNKLIAQGTYTADEINALVYPQAPIIGSPGATITVLADKTTTVFIVR